MLLTGWKTWIRFLLTPSSVFAMKEEKVTLGFIPRILFGVCLPSVCPRTDPRNNKWGQRSKEGQGLRKTEGLNGQQFRLISQVTILWGGVRELPCSLYTCFGKCCWGRKKLPPYRHQDQLIRPILGTQPLFMGPKWIQERRGGADSSCDDLKRPVDHSYSWEPPQLKPSSHQPQ